MNRSAITTSVPATAPDSPTYARTCKGCATPIAPPAHYCLSCCARVGAVSTAALVAAHGVDYLRPIAACGR